jgi:hypothetical protein
MPTVPGCDQAIVEPTKVAAYLLSGTHPLVEAKQSSSSDLDFARMLPTS